MSVVTVTPEPEGEGAPKIDDAAFAAGQTVGRFESHMNECLNKHLTHDSSLADVQARLSAVEALSVAAVVTADQAVETAIDAEIVAEEAIEDVDATVEDEVDAAVVEMEMPEVPVETPSTKKQNKGWLSGW